jgi:hypothetical protein
MRLGKERKKKRKGKEKQKEGVSEGWRCNPIST